MVILDPGIVNVYWLSTFVYSMMLSLLSLIFILWTLYPSAGVIVKLISVSSSIFIMLSKFDIVPFVSSLSITMLLLFKSLIT